jgi:predicted TIM-barrel fold metal-dependent hydrolase
VVNALETPTPVKSSGSSKETFLIDTDVHEAFQSTDVLLPYLAQEWARYLTGGGEYSWPPSLLGSFGIEYAPWAAPMGSARRDWFLPDGGFGWDLDAMRRHLFDETGVSVAILNGSFRVGSLPTDHEFGAALASAYNDWEIDHWLDRDKRLRGSVHVMPHLPDLAAREIDRVGQHPQMVQVFLPLSTDRQYGDPAYRPIFEAASRNGLVVALHHGTNTGSALGRPRLFVEWHTTAPPQAAASQIVSLVCNGTFDRYPELKVVCLETGVSWVPWLLWRLDQQYRELRTGIPWVKRLPSAHIRDSVRFGTQPITEVTAKQFTQLVEMSESECLWVFATDYPHYDSDSTSVLDGLSPELRRRIRYENALDFYPRLAAEADVLLA